MKRTIRFLIDWAAITAGGAATYMATGSSYFGMIAGMIVVASYGMWCFTDGAST